MSFDPTWTDAARQRWQTLRGRWWVVVLTETTILAVALIDAIPPWSGSSGWNRYWIASYLAVAGLLARHRLPLLSWLLCLPGLIWGTVLVAPLVAVFSVSNKARRWWVVAVVVVGTFAAQIVEYQLNAFGGGQIALLQWVVYAAVVAAGPAALGLLLAARRRLAAQLQQLADAGTRERTLLTESVLAEERTRLAREMHDVVSHQVSLIALQAGALRVTTAAPDAREAAATIRSLATRTLDELRAMVGILRGGQSTDLGPQPRLSDIARLVSDSGLPAILHSEIAPEQHWPEPVQRAAYRSVQEGLTNARKHAPGAPVTVRLRSHGSALHVHVHNDAPPVGKTNGFSLQPDLLPNGGHGLIGLRERAELLGGRLEATTTQTGGFDLHVTLGPPGPQGVR